MTVQKLASTDAFVVVDFPDAPASGIVRRAKKILQSSATDMARSATYTFAVFGHQRSGASAGINAIDGPHVDAISAFVEELRSQTSSGQLQLLPGKGVSADDLAGNGTSSTAGSAKVLTAGLVASTGWALGGTLEGKRIAIEQTATARPPASLAPTLEAMGATVVEVADVEAKPWLIWGADVDVILAGSKLGVLTHKGAEMVTASAIVPWGPAPVTTKAFAILSRSGTTLLPDFVTASGPLLAGVLPGESSAVIGQIVSDINSVLDETGGHDEGLFLGACKKAEAFIKTWQDTLPFGRPLAG